VGLLTLLPKLPFLPVIEVIRIAGIIREETERQYHDPAQVRRELEEAQQQWASGNMSDDELSRIEYTATTRLYGGMPAARSRVPASRRQTRTVNRRQTRRGDRHG
jgi:Gas vesicle protein G